MSIKLFLVLIFAANRICAQPQAFNNSFNTYNVEDGLSQSTVNAILQDRNGFMWFGTGDGLNRFDGHNFKVFKHLDSNSIINNSIRKILEDKNGNLWIGTDGGISIYYSKIKTFYHFPNKENERIYLLCIDNNKIWFWKYDKGIGYIDVDTRVVKTYYSSMFAKSVIINAAVFVGKTKEIILATSIGLLCIDTKSTNIPIVKFSSILSYAIKLSSTKQLIVGAAKELVVFENIEESKKNSYQIQNKQLLNINSIEEDLFGNIWLGSYGNGLFILNKNRAITRIENQGKSTNLIKTIYRDHDQNMWIGTDGNGVKNWSSYKVKFNQISQESNLIPDKLSSNFIKCFAETPNKEILIAGLDKGVNVFNSRTNTNTITTVFGKKIHRIYKDPTNEYWIIADQKLTLWDKNLMHPKEIIFPKLPYSFIPNCILTDSKKNTWIGCSTGLFKIDSSKNVSLVSRSDSFSFHAIFEDSKHQLWFSTNEDVMRFKINETELYKVKQLEKTNIRAFAEIDKILWLSGQKGLIEFSIENGEQRKFGLKDGLADQMIYGAIPEDNNLWLSSNNGISRFNTKSKLFRNYKINDGLQSKEFNSNAFFKASNGYLYFGGINGVNYFDPSKVLDNPNKPKIAITNIKLFDMDLPINDEVSQLKEIELNHDQNILSFEFASLEFTDEKRNEFAYKMEGIDTGWVSAGIRNFVRYANLQPGNYIFKVKSFNNDGIGDEIPRAIGIHIKTPWWKSWWFKSLVILLLIGCIYLVFKLIVARKLNAIKQKNDKLMAVEKERSRISQDMHDDMGSGLSKIAILSQVLKSNLENNKEKEQIEKISQTAQDLVDSMGHIVWSMNPENNQLENLASYIREYAIDFFEGSEVNCKIDLPNEMGPIELSQRQRRNVFLVMKETLNNTLKYAAATEVLISLLMEGDKIVLVVSDNGKGFDLTQTRRFGNGLINMKKRMDEIGGFYQIESKLNIGTTTTVKI